MGFDLHSAVRASESAGLPVRWLKGDVAEVAAVDRATRGIDAVVHLAVAVGEEDYGQPELPLSTNVLGTYNVFEAARRRQVLRIVLVSSAAVHLAPITSRLLDARSDWRSDSGPGHLYDLTKRLQEEIARDFCETFAMSAVVLRAGHIVDGRAKVDARGRPLETLDYTRGGWVCRHDLARACLAALRFESTGYHAFHVIGSRAARDRFDIDRTERELGFRCQVEFAEFE